MKNKQQYSTKFKISIVKSYQEGKDTMRNVALKAGISCGTLSKWMKKYGNLSTSPEINPQIDKLHIEIKRLDDRISVLSNVIRKKLQNDCDILHL